MKPFFEKAFEPHELKLNDPRKQNLEDLKWAELRRPPFVGRCRNKISTRRAGCGQHAMGGTQKRAASPGANSPMAGLSCCVRSAVMDAHQNTPAASRGCPALQNEGREANETG